MPGPKFSVVVPLFNEEFAVAGTILAIRDYFEQRGESYEILLVDNASTDRTRANAEPLLDGPKIRLLVNAANLGKGFSVRRGMLEARGELRLHCDADCASSLASLAMMLELLDENDLVVGSRLAAGAQLEGDDIVDTAEGPGRRADLRKVDRVGEADAVEFPGAAGLQFD